VKLFCYLRATSEPVDLCCGQHVCQSAESVDQHGEELDDEDHAEENNEQHADRFQLQILFGNGYLKW